jgi:hypothetical protein
MATENGDIGRRRLVRVGHVLRTPITDTLRSLLSDQHVGRAGIWAVAWCLAITAAAFVWAGYAKGEARLTPVGTARSRAVQLPRLVRRG